MREKLTYEEVVEDLTRIIERIDGKFRDIPGVLRSEILDINAQRDILVTQLVYLEEKVKIMEGMIPYFEW